MNRAPIPLNDFVFGHEDDDDHPGRGAEEMMEIRDAFRHIFSTPQGEKALTYLYHFCGQGMTTHGSSDRDASFNEGKRRVYLQIAGFVQMTDERLYELVDSQSRERALR